MAIETTCPGCGKLLRVGDEAAGKPMRCPACNRVSAAPSAVPTAAIPETEWYMRTPEGHTYGPVKKSELDNWAAEGRMAADCLLSQSASGPWSPATQLFPALRPLPTSPVVTAAPSAPPIGAILGTSPSATGQYVVPHRGGLILVLAVLGIVMTCPIFSLMAWVMGSGDLREMQNGRMDRSGESITRLGYFLGMILSLLWIGGAVLVLFATLIAAVSGA